MPHSLGSRLGEFLNESRLAEMQARIDRHFGKDQLVHLDGPPRPVKIRKPIAPVDLWNIGKPGITETLHVIEMDMGVNDWKFRHFSFPVLER